MHLVARTKQSPLGDLVRSSGAICFALDSSSSSHRADATCLPLRFDTTSNATGDSSQGVVATWTLHADLSNWTDYRRQLLGIPMVTFTGLKLLGSAHQHAWQVEQAAELPVNV